MKNDTIKSRRNKGQQGTAKLTFKRLGYAFLLPASAIMKIIKVEWRSQHVVTMFRQLLWFDLGVPLFVEKFTLRQFSKK